MNKSQIKRKIEQSQKAYSKAEQFEKEAKQMIENAYGIKIDNHYILEDMWIDTIHYGGGNFNQLWKEIKKHQK